VFVSLILWFAPKATANVKLIFETTAPLFHALGMGAPRNGPDYHVYPDNANYARVWNTGHPTKNNMSIAVQLPWPNTLFLGQIMELLIDNVPKPVGEGRNRMWIIAEYRPRPFLVRDTLCIMYYGARHPRRGRKAPKA
jgi:hypothetical protein